MSSYLRSIDRWPWWAKLSLVAIPVFGVGAILVTWVTGEDGNDVASWYESDVTRVELCPDRLDQYNNVKKGLGDFEAYGWKSVRLEVVSRCRGQAPPGVTRIHACETQTFEGDFACAKPEHPGEVLARVRNGRLKSADIYLRNPAEMSLMGVTHEIGHGVYGIALDWPDGSDGHDEHDSRLMSHDGGLSWVGIDRRPGGVFELEPFTPE